MAILFSGRNVQIIGTPVEEIARCCNATSDRSGNAHLRNPPRKPTHLVSEHYTRDIDVLIYEIKRPVALVSLRFLYGNTSRRNNTRRANSLETQKRAYWEFYLGISLGYFYMVGVKKYSFSPPLLPGRCWVGIFYRVGEMLILLLSLYY